MPGTVRKSAIPHLKEHLVSDADKHTVEEGVKHIGSSHLRKVLTSVDLQSHSRL